LEKFGIAGLTVEFEAGNGLLYERSRPYLKSDESKTDIKIELDDDFFARRWQSYPMLSLDECRYVWTGEAFYLKLLDFGGFMLHSSCVCRGGNAYLFSARSGTGKSTHTHLWLREFPDAYILNDDKPAVMIRENGAVAYGTPFSGKNDESRNEAASIRAIVFIERSAGNSIEKISPASAVPLFMSQTVRPKTPQYMGELLFLLDRLLKTVPVFLLKCNMDPSAAHTSYDGIEEYYRQNSGV